MVGSCLVHLALNCSMMVGFLTVPDRTTTISSGTFVRVRNDLRVPSRHPFSIYLICVGTTTERKIFTSATPRIEVAAKTADSYQVDVYT